MALKQHLRDAGHRAEVGVNLERRMHRPEIRQGAFAKESLIDFMRFFSFAQAGAAVHPVSQGPARRLVTTQVERLARGLHPLGSSRIDECPGIERAEVGDVAVLGIADIAVVRLLAVFFDLPIRADLDRIQPTHLLADRLEEGLGFAQLFCQRERVGEGFPHEALVECAACGDEILSFGRAARDPFDLLGSGTLLGRSGGLDQKKFPWGTSALE